MTITADDLGKLRHMLGATPHKPKRDWGFRNYYACGKNSEPAMERLVAAGFVVRGQPYQDSFYYHATAEGCRAIGLNAKQTKRAMEDS